MNTYSVYLRLDDASVDENIHLVVNSHRKSEAIKQALNYMYFETGLDRHNFKTWAIKL